jgi:hypothetical protein
MRVDIFCSRCFVVLLANVAGVSVELIASKHNVTVAQVDSFLARLTEEGRCYSQRHTHYEAWRSHKRRIRSHFARALVSVRSTSSDRRSQAFPAVLSVQHNFLDARAAFARGARAITPEV